MTKRLLWFSALALSGSLLALLLAAPVRAWWARRTALADVSSALPELEARITPEVSSLPEAVPEGPRGSSITDSEYTPAARAPAPVRDPMNAQAVPAVTAPAAALTMPSREQVAEAVRATPIVLFSTSWCPVCQKARAFLRANGLGYVERDIDRDEAARSELERRSGRTSIPTLEIDGRMLTPGLNPTAVMQAVAASVERKLHVSGIAVQPR